MLKGSKVLILWGTPAQADMKNNGSVCFLFSKSIMTLKRFKWSQVVCLSAFLSVCLAVSVCRGGVIDQFAKGILSRVF